jgi:hypothetical protein
LSALLLSPSIYPLSSTPSNRLPLYIFLSSLSNHRSAGVSTLLSCRYPSPYLTVYL